MPSFGCYSFAACPNRWPPIEVAARNTGFHYIVFSRSTPPAISAEEIEHVDFPLHSVICQQCNPFTRILVRVELWGSRHGTVLLSTIHRTKTAPNENAARVLVEHFRFASIFRPLSCLAIADNVPYHFPTSGTRWALSLGDVEVHFDVDLSGNCVAIFCRGSSTHRLRTCYPENLPPHRLPVTTQARFTASVMLPMLQASNILHAEQSFKSDRREACAGSAQCRAPATRQIP
jgi:hypothetical protein